MISLQPPAPMMDVSQPPRVMAARVSFVIREYVTPSVEGSATSARVRSV